MALSALRAAHWGSPMRNLEPYHHIEREGVTILLVKS
jgi:hypothetical protein